MFKHHCKRNYKNLATYSCYLSHDRVFQTRAAAIGKARSPTVDSFDVGNNETGTMGTLTSQAEIGVLVQAPGGALLWESGGITPGKILKLYTQNHAIWCIFGGQMVRNAVHNAFLNTLTIGTTFPRVPLEMAPVNVNVNVNVNLYSALSHSASNALNVPNTADTNASSTGDRSWRC